MEENIAATDLNDGLPDSESCRAREHDDWDHQIVHCLIKHPLCNFALYFGTRFLCRHPQRKEIVERTKALVVDSTKAT